MALKMDGLGQPGAELVRSVQWKLLLATGCALLLGLLDSMWSDSGDFAHHYALVARIFEHWQFPDVFDLSLGEMNYYPRWSHYGAAWIGHFFGSPLVGMQVLAISALLLIWTALGLMAVSLHRWAGVLACAALAGLLVANKWLRLDVHGTEIVGNYFFAQMVAQSVVLVAVFSVLQMETRKVSPLVRYGFLVVVVVATVGIHLLPALELLALLFALIAVDLWSQAQQQAPEWRKAGALGLGVAVVGTLCVVLHPMFLIMQDIAKNNGHISPKWLPTVEYFAMYALVVGTGALALVWAWLGLKHADRQLESVAIKYVGVYGLAVAGMCAVQILSLYWGQGSEYAVKKHVFALHGAFMLEAAAAIGLISAARMRSRAQLPMGSAEALLRGVLPSVVVGVAIWSVLPGAKSHDASDLVDLERQILLRRDGLMPIIPGKFDVVVGLNGVPGSLAYALSIGVLKTARYQNSLDVFFDRPLSDWAAVGSVVTSENSYLDQNPKCRRAPPARAMVVADGACVARAIHEPSRQVGFRSTDSTRGACVTTGFGKPESFGTWIEQGEATVKCRVPLIDGKPPKQLLVDTEAFLDHVDLQRVRISVQGAKPIE